MIVVESPHDANLIQSISFEIVGSTLAICNHQCVCWQFEAIVISMITLGVSSLPSLSKLTYVLRDS